ncbi:MAG: hypothetical protein ACFWTS_04580 [Pseudoclavibacter caeni]
MNNPAKDGMYWTRCDDVQPMRDNQIDDKNDDDGCGRALDVHVYVLQKLVGASLLLQPKGGAAETPICSKGLLQQRDLLGLEPNGEVKLVSLAPNSEITLRREQRATEPEPIHVHRLNRTQNLPLNLSPILKDKDRRPAKQRTTGSRKAGLIRTLPIRVHVHGPTLRLGRDNLNLNTGKPEAVCHDLSSFSLYMGSRPFLDPHLPSMRRCARHPQNRDTFFLCIFYVPQGGALIPTPTTDLRLPTPQPATHDNDKHHRTDTPYGHKRPTHGNALQTSSSPPNNSSLADWKRRAHPKCHASAPESASR